MWSRASRSRLTTNDLHHFPDDTLFHKVARVVCEARCLPRKELFESWEVARRARRRLSGGPVFDLAGGHGLVAWFAVLLDDSTPEAMVIDRRVPKSAERLRAAIEAAWPRVAGRVRHHQGQLRDAPVVPGSRVFAVHACGALTDEALDLAMAADASVVALPCCHAHDTLDDGSLAGWLHPSVAIDATRAARLRTAGYRVWTQTIPDDITAENRLLIARAASAG